MPPEDRSMHETQSDMSLASKLYPVPKNIRLMSSAWAPNAVVFSFKLETDDSASHKKHVTPSNYVVNIV